MYKTGRISNKEGRFIEEQANILSIDSIAKELSRKPESVDKYMKERLKIGLSHEDEALYSLESRPYWIEITKQFSKSELDTFKYHWGRVIGQFKDDVIPTEEIQVVDLIKLELLMNRCLSMTKSGIDQISSLESDLSTLRQVPIEDREDMQLMLMMEQQLGVLKSAQESIGRDYRDLLDKKNKMLKDMRATREQRVKRYEDRKESFSAWMVTLMSDPDLAEMYGRDMEKRRMAMEKERERLSEFHVYSDGSIDQPFLTSESVKEE